MTESVMRGKERSVSWERVEDNVEGERSDKFFFLVIRRPPRSTQSRSSAASDVYKNQAPRCFATSVSVLPRVPNFVEGLAGASSRTVSHTHLRAHETGRKLVCRLLLEKKKSHDFCFCFLPLCLLIPIHVPSALSTSSSSLPPLPIC